jgi:hypothetical protein
VNLFKSAKATTDCGRNERKLHTLQIDNAFMYFISPSSDVKNEVMVTSPKPCLFPPATDISYVVYGVRFSNLYLFTLSVIVFRVRELSFFSLIQNPVRFPSPVLSGCCQDISALLDLMFVNVRFVGLSGNRARKKGGQSVRYITCICIS